MAAPGGSFGAAAGTGHGGHYLGVGLDFGAVGMGGYEGLEGGYHGHDDDDEGDEDGDGDAGGGGDDVDGGGDGDDGNGGRDGDGDGDGGNNNNNGGKSNTRHDAGGGGGGRRSGALGGRGARGAGFGGYRDARHESAMAQQQHHHQHQHHQHHQQSHQQQHPRHLPVAPGLHQSYHHPHPHPQQRQAPAGQFGILMPTPRSAAEPEDNTSSLRNPGPIHDYHRHQIEPPPPTATPAPYKLSQAKLVIDPPDLQAWRERLFQVDDLIILTHEQFETYFPHIDNVYSHRSTQRYKRKPFISHYWDCRMKGRPPGTPKSDDPNKKKRKRSTRERDLCDVKIKITEYFPDAGAEAALDRDVAAAIAAGTAAHSVVSAGQRFWTIQRVNGNGGNGKADGVAGPHRHTLERSDEIKKSSVQRFVSTRDKEGKKVQRTPLGKAVGAARETARMHSKNADLRLYAATFCPFSQRVWIALEAKGQAYQYIETDPFKRPAPTPLLEANPRGRVPAVRQGDWACSESAVILEYINARLVPTFFSLLQPPISSQRPLNTINASTTPTSAVALFQSHLTALILAADEQGPYFLGPSLSLVDIHFAPFALRLSRILHRRYPNALLADATSGTRWHRWLNALEMDPHIRATTGTDEFYLETVDLLLQTSNEGG
ncbi:uncharacterized protein Triagg1_6247 [Trichoderma aggressivum f. europaeum]|uniref:GST N-terminal domain-containing protein n=1 Tax=Trichoderma aggressivum f. europaeum TaxID=173218 RepID=A0AAE1IBB7_9HYPO|nr:hypothetical protein Triagg1_6247 [Trichoderma aggressivum f. europaeum]